jgi:hypothetical protein
MFLPGAIVLFQGYVIVERIYILAVVGTICECA